MNLLDNIKNAAMKSKEPQGQTGGATEATFQDLRTAKTGKANRGGPSGQSSLTEGMAIAEASQGQQQVQEQLQQEQQKAGVTEEQQALQQEQVESQQKMQSRANDQEYQNQIDSMYNNLEQNYQKMEQEEQEMALEQVAFDQRLDNEQYVAGLQDRGKRARLDDANNFREEMRKQVLGEDLALLEKDFDNRMMEANKQDDYTVDRAKADSAYAMKVLSSAMDDAMSRQITSGIAGLASTGVDMAASSGKLGEGMKEYTDSKYTK